MRKIKTLLILASFLTGVKDLCAQSLAINTDGSTANTSAILDVKSTAKGMLIPRLTSVQRSAIGSPANGLMVYDTDSLSFAYYNGSAWSFLKGTSNNSLPWAIKGNAGTNASNNFIGTTDAVELKFRVNNVASGEINHNTNNTFLGYKSGFSNSGSVNNTATGSQTLFSNTTGYSNVAMGIKALYLNTDRSNLVAIGDSALYNNGTGASVSFEATENVAVGSKALFSNSTGYDNTAIGFEAMKLNTTGAANTASGYQSLLNNTTGFGNVAMGLSSMTANKTGSGNVAVGYYALANNTNSTDNVALGNQALLNHYKNNGNIGIGKFAFWQDTTGQYNIGIGYQSGYNNRSGNYNTAIGQNALYNNKTGNNNIAIGRASLQSTQGLNDNIAIGDSAQYAFAFVNSSNIAIGSKALKTNINGYDNIAIGNGALTSGNGSATYTNSDNIAIGYDALKNNGVGAISFASSTHNVAIGNSALAKNTTGMDNTAIGLGALFNNTTGIMNVAIGSGAFNNTADGNRNITIGYNAGTVNTTGDDNIAIGIESDFAANNFSNAIAIGSNAYVGASNSMVLGSINAVNGALADTKVGIGVTAPSEKLEIGNGRLRFKGNMASSAAHGITWTDNAGVADKTFIGIETDNYWGIYNYGLGAWNIRVHNTSGEMGINKQPGTTASESRLQIKQTGSTGALRAIGIETAINTNRWDIWVDNNAGPDFNFNYNGAIRGYIQNATGNYIVSSDRRLKKDLQPAAPALANLIKLPVYTFRYNNNTNTDPVSIGFMAQDVQKFYPNATPVKSNEKGEERLGLNYQAMTALSIKAIQEQQQIIDNQNKKIDNLQAQIDELKKLIKKD